MGEVPSTDASRKAPDKCSLRRYRSAKVARFEISRSTGRWTVPGLHAGVAAYGAIVQQSESLATSELVPPQSAGFSTHLSHRPIQMAAGEGRCDAHGGGQGPGVRSGLRPLSRGDQLGGGSAEIDRKSTRLNSSHLGISYAV